MVTAKQIANILPYTFAQRPVSEARAIQSKGGKTMSPKRIIANRLKNLKRKGLTDTTALQFWEALTYPEVSGYDQYMYLKKLQGELQTTQEKIIFSRMMKDWHEMHFGKNIPQNQINIQNNKSNQVIININIDDESESTKRDKHKPFSETSTSD